MADEKKIVPLPVNMLRHNIESDSAIRLLPYLLNEALKIT